MKELSLSEALKEINKKYGNDSLIKVSDLDERIKIDSLSTSCLSLNNVFACGGMPRGRIIEIFGMPSHGKTTLALFLVAEVQKNGGKAAWIDAEFSFSQNYANKIGVDTKNLFLSQPNTGEMAFDIVESLIKTNEIDIIVIDSTAALVPESELEGEIYDQKIALQARLISKGLRMITGLAAKTKTTIIFISQVRDKIGSFLGPTKVSGGGNALKFYSSVRLEVTKVKTIKDGDENVIGNRLKIEAVKNKVGLPFRKTEIDLYFERGIDIIADIFDVGVIKNTINKSGNTYSFKDIKLGVGRENCIDFLNNKDNEKILKEIVKELNN